MADKDSGRDRQLMREIHKVFWQANLVDKRDLAFCYLLRVPAVIVYNVLIPVQIAYGIQAIVLRNFGTVEGYAWRILILSIVYAIMWTLGGFAISRNAIIGVDYLIKRIFSNYLQKDYDFYSNTYFGALSSQVSRIRDAFNEYGQMVTLTLPKQLSIIISGIAIIGYHSILLAIVTILTVGAVLVFTLLSTRWRLKYRRVLGEASSELNGVVGDALSHATTVKIFAAEKYEEERLDKTFQVWAKAQYNSWVSSLPADTGRMIMAAVATVALLALTSRLYQERVISIAIVALAQIYVVKMVSVTQDIAEIIKNHEATMSGSYQPIKTMLVTTAVNDPDNPLKFPDTKQLDLSFEDVSYRYKDASAKAYAISKFDLQVNSGEKLGVVGYSGSGKTTLTKLIMRFMDTTSGSIKVNGIDIKQLTQSDIRENISYVPQDPLLFNRSVGENIAYGKPTADKKEVLRAAHLAYADEFIEELPLKYDTVVGERGVKLSGGQRQRVAIARAILKDSPILVLDEATSSLDSKSEKLIQEALWHLIENRTAIVIAHRLSTIQRMDRIVVMDKGRIVQSGTHKELLADKNGIYAELWSHQSGGYIGVKTTKDN